LTVRSGWGMSKVQLPICSHILIPKRNTSIVTCSKFVIPQAPFRIYMNGCQPDGEKYGTSPGRPPLRKVGRNCFYYIQYLLQYWIGADKENLKARLTTKFKMATTWCVKRKWVRNQLWKTDRLHLSGRNETFSVRIIRGTPGKEAGSNKDDPADEHWFCFNRGELTFVVIFRNRVSCCRWLRSLLAVSSFLDFCKPLSLLWISALSLDFLNSSWADSS